MRRRLMTLMAASAWAVGSAAQAPTADLLDVVFKSDGTAEDVSAMKNEVKAIGSPHVVESPKFGMNVACLSANYWGSMPQSYYRVDYDGNQAMRDALNDGFAYEVLVRPVSNVMGTGNAAVLSSHQDGGARILINGESGISFESYVGEASAAAQSTSATPGGEYYHVVGVMDPAGGTMSIYVNGEVAQTVEVEGQYCEPADSLCWFAIGGDTGADGWCSNAFAGDIAVARIYGDPLSADQARALYTAAQARDTGEEEHEATPAKNGYFTFNTAAANHLIVTQEDMYQYHFKVTGGDPWIYMSPLQADLGPDEGIAVIEYKTAQAMNNAEFFFSPIAGGREQGFSLPASEDWTTAYVNIESYTALFNWGKAGDFLRIDLGSVTGSEITLRNLRIISFAEYKKIIADEVVDLALEQDEDGWYLVNNADDLVNLAKAFSTGRYNGINVRMTDNIDMSDVTGCPPIGWTLTTYSVGQPLSEVGFDGVFDGQGYTISNYTAMHNVIFRTTGIFGTVTGTVKNVGVDGYSWAGGYSGRHGALVGVLFNGRVENCYVVNSRVEHVGDIGSSVVAGNYGGTVENCFEFGNTLVTYPRSGWLVGDNRDNNSVRHGKVINCYSASFVTGEGISGGYAGGKENCQDHVTAERFASGEIAYLLNGGRVDANVAWRQNLEDDPYPVLNKEHDIAAQTLKGTILALSADNSLVEFAGEVAAEEADLIENTICRAELTARYTELIEQLEAVETMEAFEPLFEEIKTVRVELLASAEAYKAYETKIAEVKKYLEENTNIEGSDLENLQNYLNQSVEPDSTQYPNGSYIYIMEKLLLNNESLDNEVEFVQHLLDRAIATGYQPGSDVTLLIANADFSGGTEGWTFNAAPSVNTVDDAGVSHVAESGEKLELNQTLSGLRPGLYELTVYAAYKANNNPNSYAQNSFIYAGNNKVYTSVLLEGMQPADPAPAYADKYTKLTDADGNTTGYMPTSATALAYAFGEGLYKHTIVAEVGEEDTLTIGVSTPGCNSSNTTWVGPFSMKYLGAVDSEHATEALDAALACQTARFTTLSEMYPAFVEENNNANVAPNYSNDLKTAVAQAIESAAGTSTNEEKLAKIAEMSTLAQEVLDCKVAYVGLMSRTEVLQMITAEMGVAGLIPESEAQALNDVYNDLINGYLDGSYSREEAETLNPFASSSAMPEVVDGVARISTPAELVMFSFLANSGIAEAMDAMLLNDIDMTGIDMYPPIGHCPRAETNGAGGPIVSFGYKGVFDGQGHSIKNLTAAYNANYGTSGVFGKNSGTIRNLVVDGYTFAFGENDPYYGRFAALCGVNYGTIENCAVINSTIIHTGEIVSSIVAGNYCGTVRACFEANNLVNPYYRAGQLIGDNVDNSKTYYGVAINCYSAGYVTGEGRPGGYPGGKQDCRDNVSAKVFASGEIAYLLNKANEGRPEMVTWKQTIGTDAYPVMDQSHMEVLAAEDGYTNYEGINHELWKAMVRGQELLSPLTQTSEAGAPLITRGDQLSANHPWGSHQINSVLDGDKMTYFHSDPSATAAFNAGEVYMQANLDEGILGFHMEYSGREDGPAENRWHDTPNKLRIMASNTPEDEDSWVHITTVEYPEIPNANAAHLKTSKPIMLRGVYSSIRIYILGTTSGNPYWNMTEFQMYAVNSEEVSYYESHPEIQLAADALQAAIETAESSLDAGNATAEDVQALEDAITALRVLIPWDVVPFAGTKDDPIRIGTAADMAALHGMLEPGRMNYVVLTADIDMAGITEWVPLNAAADTDGNQTLGNWIDFDGQGHVISNFSPSDSVHTAGSFFGVLCGDVRNVGFENANVYSPDSGTGILVGQMGHAEYSKDGVQMTSTLNNVWVTGKLEVNADYAGSLVGNISGPSYIKNVYANVNVSGSAEIIGGLVGSVRNQLTILNAYATGSIANGGGIIGGDQREDTAGAIYKDIVVWNNTDQNFGPIVEGVDQAENITYYDGNNFTTLQQTVVGWGAPWQCSMAEGEYPTFDLATAIDKITSDPVLKNDVASVYNTAGEIVYIGKVGQMNLKPGIYVIKAGGRTYKMAIK